MTRKHFMVALGAKALAKRMAGAKPGLHARPLLAMLALASCALGGPGEARAPAIDFVDVTGGFRGGGSSTLPSYLQCVPYARMVSGIQLRGDAHSWWKEAEGRYARGFAPRVGAVMAFRPHGAMVLGHVAAVSRIIDKRTILLRHANWSPIHGRRGQVEENVTAVDVSPRNDWSEVRVWFDPLKGLGSTRWPVDGFIYNRPARSSEHGITRSSWMNDPIGAIIAAFSRK